MENNKHRICHINPDWEQFSRIKRLFKIADIMPDFFFKKAIFLSGLAILLLVISILASLIINSLPSIKAFGFKFLTSRTWDPVFEQYGALPFTVGTILTSFLALVITIPFSLAISLYLGGDFIKEKSFFAGFLKTS
ncbi:MAG: hypothetical protein NC830_02410, partial [Candidatus Omnitrophica bacterium]|nr:hypothetical protein [Candidatus Omnitrophota bacterium]